MKISIKNLTRVILPVFTMLGALAGSAQTTVSVDSTQNWIGYVNVFALPSDGGAYMFGSAWGTGALTAFFDPTGLVSLTLDPCTNVWNPTDTYWVKPNGAPNKTVDASMYVQNDTLAGETITFVGTCSSYTLNSEYTCTAFIKDFSPGYSLNNSATVQLAAGQPFNLVLATGAGDHIQYGFETIGPDANPATVASLGKAVLAVNNVDPSLSAISGQALVQGQNATFTVVPKGTAPFTYHWSQVTPSGSNVLSTGGRISISSGALSTLTISSVQASDAGTYFITVTDPHGSNTENASLVVIPLAQAKTNYLIDPSFESGTFATASTAGWVGFNGYSFQNNQEYYYLSDEPVSVFDGTNCLEIYNQGTYDGAYQDRPASPGEVFTANAWFLTPSSDQIQGSNTCKIEVQFRDANGDVLLDYESSSLDTNTLTDTWIEFVPSNIYLGDFVTLVGTAPYLVAPANTTDVRYQFTFYSPDGDGGEADVDGAVLTLRQPPVNFTVTNGNVQISFPTLYGPSYAVYYKTALSDPTWRTLTTLTGDSTVHNVTDTVHSASRFYVVDTQ